MSQDAPATDANGGEGQSRSKYGWVRWAILGVAVGVLLVDGFLVWDQLELAWESLLTAT